MKKRIIGIDVARALAVIGMIIVNFKIALGSQGNQTLEFITGLLEGKAAALFVVLAGVGLAFMSNSAIAKKDVEKLKRIKTKIGKRAAFLFIVGLLYTPIWTADILHFYGIYMLFALLALTSERKYIIGFATLLVLLFPFLVMIMDYEVGWNFETLEYIDFWTIEGFVRNLFYNGFHPVIPWAAFMLIGLWFGKLDLNNSIIIKKSLWWSLGFFVVINLFSIVTISILAEGNEKIAAELQEIVGTSTMPPMPFYMISGSSLAIAIISICILIAKRLEGNFLIDALNKTGQLALTFYVAHVIIGMGIMEAIYPNQMGKLSLEFSFVYALIFSVLCIIFAIIWTRYKKSGPLEWIMRKVTD